MQEKKRILSLIEVFFVAILSLAIYLGGVMLIFGKEYNLPWRMISSGTAVFIVLGFDVIWIIMMVLRPRKNVRAKVLLTLIVLILSAIVLTDLFLIDMWHKMW
jgi:hypothetical protein